MSAVGDTAGYVVLVQNRTNPTIWHPAMAEPIDSIRVAAHAVRAMERTQTGALHQDTYAVAKLELVMVSRPGQAREEPNG